MEEMGLKKQTISSERSPRCNFILTRSGLRRRVNFWSAVSNFGTGRWPRRPRGGESARNV